MDRCGRLPSAGLETEGVLIAFSLMTTRDERNARLDALVEATKTWATRRREDLKNRSASCKKILQGRTGSERLAQSSVQAASDLVVQSIDDFLVVS